MIPAVRRQRVGGAGQAQLEHRAVLGRFRQHQVAAVVRKITELFRDQQGLEVDFMVPQPNAKFWLVEAKAGRTVQSTMASPLQALKKAATDRVSRSLIVHRKARTEPKMTTVAPGVEALSIEQFSAILNS